MQTNPDTGVAEITVGELHDILAGAHQYHNDSDDGDYPIEKYTLQHDAKDLLPEHYAELEEIVSELNRVLRKYRELDSKFHDIADCR
jgi:hypothetical protein